VTSKNATTSDGAVNSNDSVTSDGSVNSNDSVNSGGAGTPDGAGTVGNHDTEVLPLLPSGGHSDLNDALAAVAPRRWWNHTTVALLGLALLAGGFLGGVQAHERWGTEETLAGGGPSGAGMPSGFAGGSGGSRGPAAPGGRPEASPGDSALGDSAQGDPAQGDPAQGDPAQGGSVQGGPALGGGAQPAMGGTVGTVKMVDGTTLYVQTDAGETITVRTGADTTVKVSQSASLESITSGLPVTVEGVPDSEGIISATAITAG
jgi:hypothetical protein